MNRTWVGIMAALVAGGCATVSPERGHDEVARVIAQRTGYETRWEKGPPVDEEIAKWIGSVLENGLTREEAIELALVNNRELGQTYEELGISQAEMVEAGMLENPSFEASVGFPAHDGILETEFSLVGNLLQLFILPLRKQVAEEQFTADTIRVAHEALDVAAEVAKTYAHVQAAQKALELNRIAVETAGAAADLADQQFRAGNITELALMTERATYEQARLETTEAEVSLVEVREELTRLLGLWGPHTGWTLADELAEIPPAEPPREQLESLAMKQRLDVDAARRSAALMAKAVGLAKNTSLFGRIEVGVHSHQDPDGPRMFGPSLELELPIFDQRQGLIGRLEAQQRQSERRLASLAINARSEVRLAQAQLQVARNRAEHYRTVLLPLRDRVLALSLLQYNSMSLSPYDLLHVKREQVESYRGYLDAVRDYWIARAELDRAVGGRVPSGKNQPLKLDVTKGSEGAHHHGH